MRSRRARALAVLLVSLSACHAAAPKTTDPARGIDGGGGARKDKVSADPGDELDSLQAELDAAHAELSGWQQPVDATVDESPTKSAEGHPRPEPPRPGPVAVTQQTRCERIATLAERICGLRDAMCLLAQEHEQEARYAQACERAGQTCDEATAAADGCNDDAR